MQLTLNEKCMPYKSYMPPEELKYLKKNKLEKNEQRCKEK
jgi:hypothetical protein